MTGPAVRDAPQAVIWHDVECGSYAADLAVWERLAAAAGSAVLDLGCGTGRVALHLARGGQPVLGVDHDPLLVAELSGRASRDQLPASAEVADVRALDLGSRRFGLAIAPMQLIQLLGGEAERHRCLRRVARHLVPGGRLALAIADTSAVAIGTSPPLPDVREVDRWIYSSLPLGVLEVEGGIVVTRLRQTVSPQGALTEERSDVRLAALSADRLESEAEACGLRAQGRIAVPPTPDHVGSIVVVTEVE
jgi:SAM-dependent methyltransferase